MITSSLWRKSRLINLKVIQLENHCSSVTSNFISLKEFEVKLIIMFFTESGIEKLSPQECYRIYQFLNIHINEVAEKILLPYFFYD